MSVPAAHKPHLVLEWQVGHLSVIVGGTSTTDSKETRRIMLAAAIGFLAECKLVRGVWGEVPGLYPQLPRLSER